MAAREQHWAGWGGALLWGGVRDTSEGGWVGRAGDSLDWFCWWWLYPTDSNQHPNAPTPPFDS